MSHIPFESVRVAAITFSIEEIGDTWERSANAVAQSDPKTGVIRVNPDHQADKLACEFVHEVFHCLSWFFEYEDHNSKIGIEAAANCAGYGLAMFWQDNPEAFKWWLGLMGQCTP